ncbi:FtsK/SpoIIIE domain-containing protein [Streptomyces sp. CA-111067]|uniref:FtsK/SpoIIIE domain-containing protein n=1 Tax=Streptomyces sp. CA-111067 TaxID=3240046 RepID=UPI003D9823FE
MQIRLTVLGPRSGRAARGFDVLITAPAGTALGAVAGALASAAGSGQPGGRSSAASVVLYAGPQRLAPTAVLGVPPLVDGALVSLQGPPDQHGDHGQYGTYGQYGLPTAEVARLRVVGGPDAGGVHLLPGGQARIGRSSEADVPLDDPDVSRLHCEVAVGADGEVTVMDLGSTNGTSVAGRPVGPRPAPLPPGALLRIGESTLRLDGAHAPAPAPLPSVPDSDGHLRVALREEQPPASPTAPLPRPRGADPYDQHATPEASPAPYDQHAPTPTIPPQPHTGPRDLPPTHGGTTALGEPQPRPTNHPATKHPQPGTYAEPGEAGPTDTARPPANAHSRPGNAPEREPGDHSPAEAGSPERTPGAPTGPSQAHPQPPTGPPAEPGHAASGDYAQPGTADRTGTEGSQYALPASGPTQPGHAAGTDATHGGNAGSYAQPAGGQRHPGDPSGYEQARGGAVSPQGGGQGAASGHPQPGAGSGDGDPGQPRGEARESARRATGERRGLGKAAGGDVERGGLVGSIGAWARRRLSGGGGVGGGGSSQGGGVGDVGEAESLRERWPDPAAVLLTALGPGRRLWERGPGHPDVLTVRLGTADLPSRDGSRLLDAVPFTVDLRAPGTSALTLAGPRPRLAGLARAVLAQLAALHSPATLEVVLLSADRARAADRRAEEWSWLNWLPHLRPGHGQDCRLLLAFDRDQAEARTAELVRRLEAGPLGAGWATAPAEAVAAAAAGHEGPFTVLVADGDPGSAGLRETVARIALAGPSVGVHVLCLAEAGERPVIEDGVTAWLSGDVATTLRIESARGTSDAGAGVEAPDDIVLDAVSAAWAEHFARALAPLREADAESSGARWRHALPGSVRLLEELDLALATPAKVAARWADAPAAAPSATVVLGTGAAGRVVVDLVTEGPHTLIGGAAGAGKTELLRSVAAALAAGERPDRLALVLVDGAGQERGEGLLTSADLPHVETHLVASDPVRMREFAQGLTAELKRRDEVLGGQPFGAWHALRAAAPAAPVVPAASSAPTVPAQGGPGGRTARAAAPGTATAESGQDQDPALPRLVVVVDDFDELVAPGLGSSGRPAAGSVVRALEAVAREGERLGVHLVATTGRPERTAGTELDERAALRIALRMADPESAALVVHVEDPAGLDDAVPGRGYVRRPGGGVTAFQAGRVSGRIPRTATLRPTVVAVEWERMGDPPARRQVRELGNGPTDLALLASALQRAAAPPAAALDVSDPPRP